MPIQREKLRHRALIRSVWWLGSAPRTMSRQTECKLSQTLAGGQLSEIGAGCSGFLPLAFIMQSPQRARYLKVWIHWICIAHLSATPQRQKILSGPLPCRTDWVLGKLHLLVHFTGGWWKWHHQVVNLRRVQMHRVSQELETWAKFSVYFGSSMVLQIVPSLGLWCQLSGSVTLA